MPETLCPKCQSPIAPGGEDRPGVERQCRVCSQAQGEPQPLDLSIPPPGCTIQELDGETIIRARVEFPRLVKLIFGIFAFAWFGSFLLALTLTAVALIRHARGSPPLVMIGSSTPLTPQWQMLPSLVLHLLIAVTMLFASLLSRRCVVEVRVREGSVRVLTGYARVGIRRSFLIREATSVRIGNEPWSTDDRPRLQIIVSADREVRFGAGLSATSRNWLAEVLRRLLLAK